METIGQRMMDARKKSDLTINQAEERSGINGKSIRAIEHDTHGMSLYTATMLCRAYDISIDNLVEGIW